MDAKHDSLDQDVVNDIKRFIEAIDQALAESVISYLKAPNARAPLPR